MASSIKSALPSRLKSGEKDDQDSNYEERHHGKTRSHMASTSRFPFPLLPYCRTMVPLCF
ncbi:hypothetical protein ACRE_082320 [Hapsidospora chrysogenum ATCC 11550]|uniref:Uncharacterized protein n=1 Tax=Hapsidospora chrysogenum (strain ATCC 11550 / CBS 779.69 / DSM 880 / IAM 14645 / JCM 23072 / IMI 49137) TaxID=857340 RepID=A0A086SVD5_HAPC1|nr:hypothetical protein ACRE_082320 [Hapsidospora chrysogenum ATCC 11550]